MTKKISFPEFQKLDMRAGQISKAEDIEGADKLYKLEVDLGTENRILVAGLKRHYMKEELEGKRCVVLCNLEPKTMKGVTSHGMILASFNDDQSKVKLIQPDGTIELGSRIS